MPSHDGLSSHEAPIPRHRPDAPGGLQAARGRTPARVMRGGELTYTAPTWLELRRDHAAARDAVHAEVDLRRDFPPALVASHGLFAVQTAVSDKREYLLRPDLGRRLNEEARDEVARRCARGAELQWVIGDGLSATAVIRQVPGLLPLLEERAKQAGYRAGQAFLVRYCRVGVMNEIGALLDPAVVVLLIGERPGLATSESLSAYLAYRPRPGHTDAQRNLISNIHARGVALEDAAERIVRLAGRLMQLRSSGFLVKEEERPPPLAGVTAGGLPGV